MPAQTRQMRDNVGAENTDESEKPKKPLTPQEQIEAAGAARKEALQHKVDSYGFLVAMITMTIPEKQLDDPSPGKSIVEGGILPFLTQSTTITLMRVSRDARVYTSSALTVKVKLHVCEDQAIEGYTADNSRIALEQATGSFWTIPLKVNVMNTPFSSNSLKKFLMKKMPFVFWNKIRGTRIAVDLDYIDNGIFVRSLVELRGQHTWNYVSTHNDVINPVQDYLTNVESCNLQLRDLQALPKWSKLEKIKGIRTTVRNYSLEWLTKMEHMFPNLEWLELSMGEELTRVCELRKWTPPPDLTIDMRYHNERDRERKLFIYSHLAVLPLIQPTFMTTLLRLQIDCLAERFTGVGHLMELIGGLKLLRRLGTISPDAAGHLDLATQLPNLEELAMACIFDKTHLFLKSLVGLEQRHRRSNLKRIAVHVLCADGLASVPEDVEKAIVSAYCQIAAEILQPGGWITLSISSSRLRETGLLQLPWILPQYFCYDQNNYERQGAHLDGQDEDGDGFHDSGTILIPRSTRLTESLPYYEALPNSRPTGTLVNNESLTGSFPTLKKPPKKDDHHPRQSMAPHGRRGSAQMNMTGPISAKDMPNSANTTLRASQASHMHSIGMSHNGSHNKSGHTSHSLLNVPKEDHHMTGQHMIGKMHADHHTQSFTADLSRRTKVMLDSCITICDSIDILEEFYQI